MTIKWFARGTWYSAEFDDCAESSDFQIWLVELGYCTLCLPGGGWE